MIRRANTVEPFEQFYLFAGWTLEETARNLVSPTGRRVDLTSSEFELLIAFLRQPGQALSRTALLGVLRGANGHIMIDRSIRLSRDCVRSWPAVPIAPLSFGRCVASAMYSA